VRNVIRPPLRITPSWAPWTYQQIRFLPQQLLLGVPEQLFRLSIDANDPSIWANNDHGIRGGFQDLGDSLTGPIKLRWGKGAHSTVLSTKMIQEITIQSKFYGDPENGTAFANV
jgi:hypothetical protein